MTPPADFIALLEWITGKPMTKCEKARMAEGFRLSLLAFYPPDPRPWEIVVIE